ncbi:MAG: M56 family metallopeptidase [Eubacterium sp.]|nr:M56 family metallopeptidase [Eubacterium sp.]
MNLIFVMSISGSIVFLLYLLTKPIASRYFTAHWQYNFLRICLLFYLLPYQCLQDKLLKLFNLIFGTGEAVNPLWDDIHTFEAKNTIYITTDGKMHYKYWFPLLIFSVFWLCCIIVSLYRQIKKYHACRNNLLLISETSDTEIFEITGQNHTGSLSGGTKQIRVMLCPFIRSPFTIGVFRPVIILPKQNHTADSSLYLSHELNHIRHYDAVWKFIAFITILLHWYNPLVYLLFYELCVVCEKNCDEKVTESLDDNQKIHYENLIIEAARHKTDIEPLFADSFSTNKRQTKERILFLTRKKRRLPCQKIITALVICIAALSMPISVLAYQPFRFYHDAQPYDSNQDIMYILFDDAPSPLNLDSMMTQLEQLDFTLSNEIIIDEYGNQYIVTAESKKNVRSCAHEYIHAAKNKHDKSGSGCIVSVYEGTYCKKCNYCLQESLVSQTTFTKCPH